MRQLEQDDDRSGLRQALWDVALKWAEGIDSDGRPMAWTLDCRELVLNSRRIGVAGRLLWALVRDRRPDMVGGLTMSADALVAALLQEAAREDTALDGLIVRAQPKHYGLRKRIEGPPVRPGARVVLVDDVVSSGRALLTARREVQAAGGEVVGAAVLVDFRRPRTLARLAEARLPVDAVFELAELGLSAGPASGRSELVPAWRWPGALTSGERVTHGGPIADSAGFVVASEVGVVSALTAAGEVRWSRPLGAPVRTAPALAAGLVLVGDGRGTVHALDPATGALAWSTALGGRVTAGPTADGIVAVTGRLVALDPATGTVGWQAERSATIHALAPRGAIAGDAAGQVTAGTWTLKTGGEVRGRLALAGHHTLVAASYDGYAYAVDATTGALRWRRRLANWLYNATTIVGNIVVLGGDRQAVALNLNDGMTSWVAHVGGRVIGAPTPMDDGWLAVGTERGDLSLLDVATGEIAHTLEVGAPIRATPAVCGDLLAVVTGDGDLRAFRR